MCNTWSYVLPQPSTDPPVIAVVGVVSQGEGWDDQATGHGAHLFTQPLDILTDPLVSGVQTNTNTKNKGSHRDSHGFPPLDHISF